MSYEIIKKIRIEAGKVYLTSTSNNVCPRTFHEWECKGLSEVLQTQGEEKLDYEILKDYEAGNMQPGTENKYSRAITRLRYLPEYQKYNWRNKDYSTKWEDCPITQARQTPEFEKLLLSALHLEKPKSNLVLSKKDWNGATVYLLRKTTRL